MTYDINFLNTASFQDIFNKVYELMIAQGVPSRNERTCLYRGPNGTACAIGKFIPDRVYTEALEGYSLSDTFFQITTGLNEKDKDRVLFLAHLQGCHDDASYYEDFVEKFTEKMKGLALSFGLKFPEKV